MSPAGAEEVLLALRHADTAFPSGGFAFSQGLEAAASLTDRLGPFDLGIFIANQIRYRWATTDRVALVRAHRLAGELEGLVEVDRELDASTLSAGLRDGSRRNGAALLTSHDRMGVEIATAYRKLVRSGDAPGHLPVAQGLLWRAAGLGETAAILVGGYQAASQLATAAVRLGLAGAMEVQGILVSVSPFIASAAAEPVEDDTPFSAFAPISEIAVALRGAAGIRLFSN